MAIMLIPVLFLLAGGPLLFGGYLDRGFVRTLSSYLDEKYSALVSYGTFLIETSTDCT